MSLVKFVVTGSVQKGIAQERARVSAAMRRAVTTTGQQAQAAVRAQSRGTGFKDGGRALANAWRMKVYPPASSTITLRPAALVWSRMPDVVAAFDRGSSVGSAVQGEVIYAKRKKYLTFPTGYNAQGGRRNAGRRGGLRVTPEQMIEAGRRGEAFVLPIGGRSGRALWCLRVAGAYGITKRTRTRLRLFVNRSTEVVTGKVKGLAKKRRDILKQGFVPMFFLMRSVVLRKRLDVEAVRTAASRWYGINLSRELAGA